jgi:hypothetical protein
MRNLGDLRSQARQTAAKQQLAKQQLAQQQELAKQHQLAQQQLAEQQQLELQEKYDSLVTQIINITNSTITINGQSHIICDHVTVTGGNNHITTTGPTGLGGEGPSGPSGPSGPTDPTDPNDPPMFTGWYNRTDSGQQNTTVPTGLTTVIVFSGYVDPTTAITNSAIPELINNVPAGKPFITLGGGNANTGQWSKTVIENIITTINNGSFSAYVGIVFDIENTNGGAENTDFEPMFAVAKTAGFVVIVTVSHTGGLYSNMSDPLGLMQAFFSSSNIDYLSPQLYDSGVELANDYTPSNGWWGPTVPWSAWQGCKPKVIPSIVDASYYPDAVATFNKVNNTTTNTPQLTQPIPLAGFIQWNQV